jgi:hypothetical protein
VSYAGIFSFCKNPDFRLHCQDLTNYSTDYELACCFEQDLYLLQEGHPSYVTAPGSYLALYSSPLSDSGTPFLDIHESLDLAPQMASILDDMRFLTASILSLSLMDYGPSLPTQPLTPESIQSKACRIYNEISHLPITPLSARSSTKDIISEAIRITAIAYSSAIAARTPFSRACTAGLRQQLYARIWRVSLSTWKKVPGIFQWILLVACPGSVNDVPGRLLRRTASVVAIYIGLQHFGLSSTCVRQFWQVQRWIARARTSEAEEEEVGD